MYNNPLLYPFYISQDLYYPPVALFLLGLLTRFGDEHRAGEGLHGEMFARGRWWAISSQ